MTHNRNAVTSFVQDGTGFVVCDDGAVFGFVDGQWKEAAPLPYSIRDEAWAAFQQTVVDVIGSSEGVSVISLCATLDTMYEKDGVGVPTGLTLIDDLVRDGVLDEYVENGVVHVRRRGLGEDDA